MIHKNNSSDNFKATVCKFILIDVIASLATLAFVDPKTTVFVAIFCIVETVIFSVYIRKQIPKLDQSADILRKQIDAVRPVVCDGPAFDKTGKRVPSSFFRTDSVIVGHGWLFMTDTTLEYYPHINATRCKSFAIYLKDIQDVDFEGSVMSVNTEYVTFRFIVECVQGWEASFTSLLNPTSTKNADSSNNTDETTNADYVTRSCPKCHAQLQYLKGAEQVVCDSCNTAFRVHQKRSAFCSQCGVAMYCSKTDAEITCSSCQATFAVTSDGIDDIPIAYSMCPLCENTVIYASGSQTATCPECDYTFHV